MKGSLSPREWRGSGTSGGGAQVGDYSILDRGSFGGFWKESYLRRGLEEACLRCS